MLTLHILFFTCVSIYSSLQSHVVSSFLHFFFPRAKKQRLEEQTVLTPSAQSACQMVSYGKLLHCSFRFCIYCHMYAYFCFVFSRDVEIHSPMASRNLTGQVDSNSVTLTSVRPIIFSPSSQMIFMGRNSSLVACWARCPAWQSVVGSILLWGYFFPVEGIFPLELTWVLTPFPQNSFGWEYKKRSSLCSHAFHRTDSKDPDIHVLDGWIPTTKSHPECTIHEDGIWLPQWLD